MNKQILSFISIALLITSQSLAQKRYNCGCTVEQVQTNSVESFNGKDYLNVITVSPGDDLRAILIGLSDSTTVLIEDGEYRVTTDYYGYPYVTASNLIIRSKSGNRDAVVLYGGGMKDTEDPDSQTENGFYAVGHNVTIADLTFKEFADHAIAVNGDSLFIHNVRFVDIYEQFLKGNAPKGVDDSTAPDGTDIGADFGTVQCCLFENTESTGKDWYTGGIDIHQANEWLIRDNVFKNIGSPGTPGNERVAEHAIHLWKGCVDNIIERNLIINCDRGIGLGLTSDPVNGNLRGIIRNNMVYHEGGLAYPYNDVGIEVANSPGTKIYNNTVYVAYSNSIEYRWPETKDVVITNNLTNGAIRSRDNAQAVSLTNVTNAKANWFVDLSSGNLRLASNISTVVNRGTTIPEVTDDIDKTERSAASKYDIGAHEYGVTSSKLISVNNTEDNVSISPNPTFNVFTVAIKNDVLKNVYVYNKAGQLLKEGTSDTIDITNFSDGCYFLKITLQSGKTVTRKVVKK